MVKKSQCFLQPLWPKSRSLLLLLVVLCILSACGPKKSGGNAVLNTGGDAVNIPPEVTAKKEILEPSILLGLPRQNPFLSLLIKDTGPDTTDSGGEVEVLPTPTPIPPDPFTGFLLEGIIYRNKDPMAILKLTGEKGSRIVRLGERIRMEKDPFYVVQVAKIDKQSVTLVVVDEAVPLPPELKTKTLQIASIIGFRNKTGGSKGRSAGKGDVSKDKSSVTGGTESILGDLGKALQGNLGEGGQNPEELLKALNEKLEQAGGSGSDAASSKLTEELKTLIKQELDKETSKQSPASTP